MEQQLLKYLYEISSGFVENFNNRLTQNFERADKIIIWIVGFAIGVFILTFQNKPKNYFDEFTSNLIIIFALTVVISGLIYRIFSFLTVMISNQIQMSYEFYSKVFIKKDDFPDPIEISESDTIEDIQFELEEDFGIIDDMDSSKLNENEKKEYRKCLVDLYNSYAEVNNRDEQIDEFKTVFNNYFGISYKKSDKAGNNDKNVKRTGKRLKILSFIAVFFFIMSIAVFIIGCIILLIHFIKLI